MNRQQRLAASVNALAERRRMMLDLQKASEEVVPYAYCTMVMAMKELTDMPQLVSEVFWESEIDGAISDKIIEQLKENE